ncbi:MAG: DNA adenine methylase [Planctomycetaceae bacterium]|nr:DNA adenine methylase [Planctomycetaceae bacterium]
MEAKELEITDSTCMYGNLNIRSCGVSFFPKDVYGAPSKNKGYGVPITLSVEGLDRSIQTDIPTDNKTGKPRWLFRERSWVKQFVKKNNLHAGHSILITRYGSRDYKISLNGHKISNEKTMVKTKENTNKCSKCNAILKINTRRTCDCKDGHINCLTAKDWMKSQIGVWQFNYEKRDIRDKTIHPATFPLSLPRKIIELFSHKGELILDPFVGSGTTLLAAQDCGRNAVGFDLKKEYVRFAENRLKEHTSLFKESKQIAICDDAINIEKYLEANSVKCIFTSPPYANLLNRKRSNKSRRDRKNEQLGKVEQYSQDPCDLGTMTLENYTKAMGDIYEKLLPLLQPKGHCVINVPDMWWENKRITIHVALIEELRTRGYELRNVIIWDRTNIVNGIGIFGWPSNYITMGVTFEYLLDFWRPPLL